MRFFLSGGGLCITGALFLQAVAVVWYCIDRWRRQMSAQSVERSEIDRRDLDPFLDRELRWRDGARYSFRNSPWRRRLRVPGIYRKETRHALQELYPSRVLELGGPLSYRCVLAALSRSGPVPHYPAFIEQEPRRAEDEARVRELP